jgi:ubiquitin-conjugating enzyme E2 Q
VRGAVSDEVSTEVVSKKKAKIPFVKLDPQHQTSVNQKVIQIPDPAFQVQSLLAARIADYVHEDPDEEDLAIFQMDSSKSSQSVRHEEYDYDNDDDDYSVPVASSSKNNSRVQRPKDDWKHNAKWVVSILENLMPPPLQSSPSASVAIQRELKSMLKEQEIAPNLRDLGWYMPPDLIGDNLYQWFVEMHSLDPALPIAKDMKDKYNIHFILPTYELIIMFFLPLFNLEN